MEQPDPLSFSNHFWGKQENGVNVLLTHFNNTKQTAEEIKAFYKERAAIEEDYAKRLIALSRKSLGAHEVGTLKTALDDIRLTTETLGKTHSNAASQFKVELEDPLTAFNSTLRTRRKAIHQLMEKLTKAKVNQQQVVDRAREKYEADCLKLNGYSAQQNLLLGKELERNNQKLEKVMISIESNKRDYQNSLRSLAEITERWTNEWKVSCDKLQDLEEERVGFFKTNLWGYTNIVSTVCVSDDEGCENIRVALEKCDVNTDFEALINQRGTGSEIMEPPEFIDYAVGETHDKPKKFSIAQFARVSSLTDSAMDSGYDPSASVMLRTSVSLAKSTSAASIMSQSTDARTVLINRQAPTLQSVAEQPHPLSQQSQPSQQHQQHQQQNQHSDLASSSFGDVPSFSHPQESSNYHISPQPSPMQEDMSRQPSVYSASSADDNEHAQANPYNIQPPKSTGTPVQQQQEPENQPAPAQQEEPPRRTWASPLRARASRIDVSSPTSKTRATDNERSNTGRFGSPLSSSGDSNAGTGNTSSTRQVLTMGDNMFDLGVSTKKSPFDARPKSASPLKSFAKDDPLVMALERLKSTSTNGAVDSQQQDDLPPPGRNPYGSTSGTIRSNAGSTSSLVPPKAAHKATDMKLTQVKYSSKTKELFDTDEQPPQSQFQRPRSNTGGDGSFRGSISHQPSSASIRQQQRPQTMYEPGYGSSNSEFGRSGTRGGHQGSVSRSVSPSPYDMRRSASPVPHHSIARSASPVPHQQMDYRRSASPAPYQQQQQDFRRSASPAPFHQAQQSDFRQSMSPNPQAGEFRGSMSPNPDYRSSASPAPFQNNHHYPASGRGSVAGGVADFRRAASPNPQPNDFSRSPSPNPMMQQQPDYRRSMSPNPQIGDFARSASPALFQQQPQQQRPGSSMDLNRNRSVSPNPYAAPPRANSTASAYGAPAGQPQLPTTTRDGQPVKLYGRAMYDYRAAIPEELSFRAGEIMLVTKMLDDGWWVCETLADGRTGYVPSNFLKTMNV
jgi:hypothetical protein